MGFRRVCVFAGTGSSTLSSLPSSPSARPRTGLLSEVPHVANIHPSGLTPSMIPVSSNTRLSHAWVRRLDSRRTTLVSAEGGCAIKRAVRKPEVAHIRIAFNFVVGWIDLGSTFVEPHTRGQLHTMSGYGAHLHIDEMHYESFSFNSPVS